MLKSADGLEAAMHTIFWLAMEGIALSKYPSLVKLQQLHGCKAITEKLKGDFQLVAGLANAAILLFTQS